MKKTFLTSKNEDELIKELKELKKNYAKYMVSMKRESYVLKLRTFSVNYLPNSLRHFLYSKQFS